LTLFHQKAFLIYLSRIIFSLYDNIATALTLFHQKGFLIYLSLSLSLSLFLTKIEKKKNNPANATHARTVHYLIFAETFIIEIKKLLRIESINTQTQPSIPFHPHPSIPAFYILLLPLHIRLSARQGKARQGKTRQGIFPLFLVSSRKFRKTAKKTHHSRTYQGKQKRVCKK
jgi:hypothetical protein